MPMHVTPVIDPGNPGARSVSLFRGIAKLKPGMTAAQAAAEGTARGRSAPDLGMVGTAVFGTQGKPVITATSFLDAQTKDVQTALSLLLAAVALLLVVAVANIAGVQLARAASRRREMAIRGALGATLARLSRQLLTENLLIGLAGGLAGAAIALFVLSVLPDLLPADFPRRDAISLDWHVFATSIAAGLIASVFFGTAATMVARRTNLVGALVEDSLAPTGLSTRSALGRWRTGLIVGQVAVAALLLAGALLLGRSFAAALHAPRGYDPGHVITAVLPMPDARFTSQRRAAMLDAIVERAAHVPGVTAAAGSSILPLVPFDQPNGFTWSPGPGHPQTQLVQTHVRVISPGYFAVLRIPITEGRDLSEQDTTTSQRVAVVNRAFARKYIQGSPIGVHLPTSFDATPGETEIVGVAEDVFMQSASEVPQPELFTSYRQRPEGVRMTSPAISVRASGDPAALAPILRDIVRQQDPSLVLDSVMTMDDRLLRSLARPRLYALTFATFSIFTLLVAGAGLYGVLSYSVAQRRRELGVRAALGASRARIVALVAKEGLILTAVGLFIGLAAAWGLGRFTSSLLYGVTTRDPLTFAMVSGSIAGVAALSIIVPARRAVRIDPLIALKQ
jgi:putative ABC transport system permease protein